MEETIKIRNNKKGTNLKIKCKQALQISFLLTDKINFKNRNARPMFYYNSK